MISVLVATRNRPDDLVACLGTLLALDHDDYELIVVDQSSTDASEAAVRDAFGSSPRVRHIRTATVGKSAALNILIGEAAGDILAFTDDDTEVPRDWLRCIESVLRDSPDADIVFGQVLAGPVPPGRTNHVPAYIFAERRFLPRREISGMGANMAMRRRVSDMGLRFDELLGPGAPMPASEEGDFIYRAQARGIRVLHDPSVRLVHRATRDGDQWLGVLRSYALGDAGFAMKHLRCGDLTMVGRIVGRYGYYFARLCWRLICRRQHQEEHYLRGYRAGLRLSLRYSVDRKRRLYIAVGAGEEAQRAGAPAVTDSSGQERLDARSQVGTVD